ncbi:chitobiase/beta-hexosaminidase C-terminal domain-containing protein, partial [bacterium]|nr:chitobiase/beta-hexosaminidase C-terminal domain-containing protein [bacterium]
DTLDASGNFNTNFKLSSGGEYLALVNTSGTIESEFCPDNTNYPKQDEDISYGLDPTNGAPVYFSSPSPGFANNTSGIAKVLDTNFSPDRGYYDQAINVTITSDTPGTTIYFTTDGTRPVNQTGNPTANASIYSGPIPVSKTTTLKASATKAGFTPTNIDCQTYLLFDIENARSDGTDPAGLNTAFLEQNQPPGWGNLSSGDYRMDTRVSKSTSLATGHQDTIAQTMLKGLRDIPTISIAMDRANFSGGNGIYTNSTNGGLEYECSAEYIPSSTDTRNDWQINCGIKVQGGASRNPGSSPKHSMNFRFRTQFGAGRLREKLFPNSEVEAFNSITLRAGYNNSWIHRDSGQRSRGSMIRDQWMRESMIEMGNPAAGHGFMVHVFVNGLYWGVHNLCERPEASHYAAYNGGDDSLLDARNGSSIVDGSATAWNTIPSVVSSGNWDRIQQVIDIDHYIDYQIINRFGGNSDLKAGGNWRAAGGGPFVPGRPEQMAPWQLYSWDGERSLESPSLNNSPRDPMGVRSQLEALSEYRIRFADRLKKHFGSGGALTAEATAARWMKFADNLDRAIIAESARWGDHRGTLYTRDNQWLTEQNRLINSYFPARSNIVEANYGSLVPSVNAPDFLVSDSFQSEGIIPVGGSLKITSTTGTIYYTTDGDDPRLPGGEINPNSTSIGGGSNQTNFIELQENGWKFLDTGAAQSGSEIVVGNAAYNTSDWKHPFFNDTGWATGQALLGYGTIDGRAMNADLNFQTPRLPTIYFRKSFTVTDAASFTQLNLNLVRDDGAIVYLNGKEIGRSNMSGGESAI